jgi:hypothetical protein
MRLLRNSSALMTGGTSKFYHSILSILPSLLLYVIITAGFHEEQPIGDL